MIFMKKATFKFALICLLLIFFSILLKEIFQIDKLIYNSLAENLSSKEIDSYFEFQSKWKWVGYFFITIYMLLKITIVSSVIYIGVFFFNKNKISYNSIWNSVLNSEFIFLLVPLSKIFWFHFFQTNYTLEDIQYFYPLSAINITGNFGIDPWLIYPLQTLNLFEVAYIVYLSYQIGHVTKTNADNGLKIVSYSYIPALLLWVTVVMFFTLNYS